MSFPVLWVGPAGSGKLRAARAALGATDEPRLQILTIGEYSARYWELRTHMEVDIMDLSMMDKQILPEMLNQLLSTRDVIGSGRKLMILRRIHAMSPPAATRLRACLEELVWAPGAPAMIWCTARVVNSVVATILDGFVYKRIAGTQRLDRLAIAKEVGANPNPATIGSYVGEMMRQMAMALKEGPPSLDAAKWIRGRVYDLLGLMITGSELTSYLVWSTVRLAAAGTISDGQATGIIDVLSRVRWVPSYRTPLMLEMIVAAVYKEMSVH
jgi:hypothetical protein